MSLTVFPNGISAGDSTIDGTLTVTGALAGFNLPVQELTASGAISDASSVVLLNHATVAVEATLPAPAAGDVVIIVNTSASGTAAHTVTCAAGVTFDGTNDVATLNAPGEALVAVAISATEFFVLVNLNSVGLSTS